MPDIEFTSLHNANHQYRDGSVLIDTPFEGNLLAFEVSTKPEYTLSKQIIGTLYQVYGTVSKGYSVYSGKDYIRLDLPQTEKLWFSPTQYLSDSYTLNLSYATVGLYGSVDNITEVPEQILGLPARVTSLESTRTEMIAHLVEIDGTIEALESANTSPPWESITDKPLIFPPTEHIHNIDAITGLSDALTSVDTDLTNLSSRVDDLESATPSTGGSISTTLLTANATLESGKRYLATVSDLTCSLPASPSTGDVIELQTDNFDLKITNGDAINKILNSNTQTTVGSDNGIVLKPFSYIKLMYVGMGLWVSQSKARTVNNFTPITEEPTATSKAYTATAPASAYGANIASAYNGVKTVGSLTNGYLSDINQGDILITLSEPILLEQIKLWNGQGNVSSGSSSGYRVNDIKVYTGHSVDGESLGTYTFTDSTATEQVKTLTPNVTPSSTFLIRVNSITPNVMGILELELWGKAATGGEVAVS